MTDSLMMGGIQLISSTMMVDYLPHGKPVHYNRKNRIHKKWLKRYGRRYIEVPKTYLAEVKPGVLVGHPILIAQLRAELAKMEAEATSAPV